MHKSHLAIERLKSDASVSGCFGPFRVGSTDGELPFGIIGFLGSVLKLLHNEGSKAGPICSAVLDHLLSTNGMLNV